MKKAAFYTLGCKVNQYETEAMSELFEKAGYQICDFDEYADVYVINTCSVTNMSDRKSRQIIRRAKKTNPNAVVAVSGCYAQTAPEKVLETEGVNAVIGTQNRKNIVEIVEAQTASSRYNGVENIMGTHEFEELKISHYNGRTRAFIKIQDGCSQFCTYCIIPYARGPVRSRNEEDIITEIQSLAANGFKEVILTGIHVAAYGSDTGTSLAELLMRIDGIDGIERVRLSSIEPMAIDATFTDTVKASKKLCRHFHLSLQSGCDETLHRMNRKYTTADYMNIVNGIRSVFCDAAITTDIMVGFPGETEAEFEKSLAFVKEVGFADAHVFQYSPRPGTPAAKWKNAVSPQIKEKRSKLMIDACAESRNRFVDKFVGTEAPVLFEREINGEYEGKTDNYIPVFVKSDRDISDEILNVNFQSRRGNSLTGTIL